MRGNRWEKIKVREIGDGTKGGGARRKIYLRRSSERDALKGVGVDHGQSSTKGGHESERGQWDGTMEGVGQDCTAKRRLAEVVRSTFSAIM